MTEESNQPKRASPVRTPRKFPEAAKSKGIGLGESEGKIRNVAGPKIKMRRLALGWTQDRLAKEISTFSVGEWNPTQPDVRRVEGQRRILADRDLLFTAGALRCTAAWLLDEPNAPEPEMLSGSDHV